jgi:hypothetical protein
MATDAQIAANRANAGASTGPRTPEGKRGSRYNALRHGLYSRAVVLPGEDAAAFEALGAELADAWKPQGPVEAALVERLANLWWRLDRAAAVEAGLLSPDWEGARTLVDPADTLVTMFQSAVDGAATLDRLGRYEGRLDRAFARTVAMLQRIQAARRAADPRRGHLGPVLSDEEFEALHEQAKAAMAAIPEEF